MGVVLIPRLPKKRWLVGIVAIASCVAYYALHEGGHAAVLRETLPPGAGAWLPNAAFVSAIIVLLARRTPNDERRTAPA
jgi:lipopolysaccharide export LptBFGC system permease protein LptF